VFSRDDYIFELPDALIAQQPAATREGSRLLHVGDTLADLQFPDIVELLPRDSVVIANDTRVIPARVFAHKTSTGAKFELLFLEPVDPAELERAGLRLPPDGAPLWRCLTKGARKLRRITDVLAVGDYTMTVYADRESGLDGPDGSIVVAVRGDPYELFEEHGHIPLPPYIDRADDAEDRERYQTMFARVPGAVAAPTAGLHMTRAIADSMTARGIALATVTLHVGWGTFAPVRVTDIRDYRMHRERYAIPAETAALVASGRPIVSLGTTALRALEAAATGDKQLAVGPGSTELFVYPGSGHTFRIVDHLITNFHLPESTLLMLVCAFAGTARVMAAYEHAVAQRYRFFSYGDAMLVHAA
jgi:S-adenosylmethionine:tRNA ribosyltransferase-isomerase